VVGGAERPAGRRPRQARPALLTIAGEQEPPLRFIAGADGIGFAEQKIADLEQQIEAYRDLSTSLTVDEAGPTRKAG
jgi:hypothetical protein